MTGGPTRPHGGAWVLWWTVVFAFVWFVLLAVLVLAVSL